MHLRGDLKISSGRFTHPGPKPQNEDFLGLEIPYGPLLATKGIVACIADGVSAASAAREASETAVRSFLTDYYETPEAWQVKTAAQRVLTAINRWLFSQGTGYGSAEHGCATTFIAVVLKSGTAHVFHIGDSRLYLTRRGKTEQITRDHSTQVGPKTSYLTRALGIETHAQIDYHSVNLETEDILTLTTDGIHEFLPHADFHAQLSSGKTMEEIAGNLGESTAHSDDNRSALILKIECLPRDDKDDIYRRLTTLPFPPDLSPGQLIDGLQVRNLITASPNSQLYLVHDTRDHDRPLVLKTPSVLYQDDPAYLERFALEEWITLRTDNRNLVKAVRRPVAQTFSYCVLESVDGISLEQWTERNPSPPVSQVIEITAGIVSGIRALHRKDTFHQDIKPGNILIDHEGTVKIIDFGSCHIGGISEIHNPFEQHAALGTIAFSAPEYRLGTTPGRRADMFSIALVTYHLLTGGKHPFSSGWDSARTLRHFASLSYTSALVHNPMVPAWMDATLKKALSILPQARHESMSEFLTYLRQPDPSLTTTGLPPLIERNPLLLWKILCLILAIALVLSLTL